jgi:hypothetical protein
LLWRSRSPLRTWQPALRGEKHPPFLSMWGPFYTCLWRSGLAEDCAVSRRTNPPQHFWQALILILANAYQSKQNDKLEPAQSNGQVPMRACASQNKSITYVHVLFLNQYASSISLVPSYVCISAHDPHDPLYSSSSFSLRKPLLTFCMHFQLIWDLWTCITTTNFRQTLHFSNLADLASLVTEVPRTSAKEWTKWGDSGCFESYIILERVKKVNSYPMKFLPSLVHLKHYKGKKNHV